jgi:hypothetical protein
VGQPVTPEAPAAPAAKPPRIPEVDRAIEAFNKRDFDGAAKELEAALAVAVLELAQHPSRGIGVQAPDRHHVAGAILDHGLDPRRKESPRCLDVIGTPPSVSHRRRPTSAPERHVHGHRGFVTSAPREPADASATRVYSPGAHVVGSFSPGRAGTRAASRSSALATTTPVAGLGLAAEAPTAEDPPGAEPRPSHLLLVRDRAPDRDVAPPADRPAGHALRPTDQPRLVGRSRSGPARPPCRCRVYGLRADRYEPSSTCAAITQRRAFHRDPERDRQPVRRPGLESSQAVPVGLGDQARQIALGRGRERAALMPEISSSCTATSIGHGEAIMYRTHVRTSGSTPGVILP